jgi:hypothetical protein
VMLVPTDNQSGTVNLLIFFETGFYYVAQLVLDLEILFPQPPMCWDYRHVPPCLVNY